MATVEAANEESARVAGDQRFLLRAVDWRTYRSVAEALSGRHVRLTYDRGNLEFMNISRIHGSYSRLLGRLIIVLTEELGLTVASCGDMTCDREDLDRGLEPDECFYIENEPAVRHKDEIDLATDPPPDLAIEIDVSRSSRDRLSIYAALRIPEIWTFDGERLRVYRRDEGGEYSWADRSRQFPFLPLERVAEFLRQRGQTDENTLIRSFRAWVRGQLATRSAGRPEEAGPS